MESRTDAESRDLAAELASAREELSRLSQEHRRTLAEQEQLRLAAEGLSAELRREQEEHRALLDRLRRREEEALRRGDERFRLILNSAGEGVYGLDTQGRAIFVNPTAARILGWEPAEMVGRSGHEVFHHSRPDGTPYPREECPMEASVRDGIPRFAQEEFFWTRTGSLVPVECTTTPIHEAGSVVGTVVVFRDITERKLLDSQRHRVMRELQDSLSARDDFLSIAAHELRTPLTSLQLRLEGILRATERKGERGMTVEQFAGRLDAARTQLDRLNRLVEQLLDVSRLRIARLDLELEQIDLVQTVHDAAARARQEIHRSGSTLTIDAPAPVIGRWDPIRMDQVVTNLLSNAIKYGSGKPIRVSVAQRDGRACFSVQDEGIGIDPEKIPRLFQRFERLVSVAHYAGFGLGLWIANQIVEAHGGTIRVSSEPGRGSTFEVELPLEAPEGSDSRPAR